MEGFQEKWVESNTRRSAYYTNLGSGGSGEYRMPGYGTP
ncbi:MAG: hypothetical protein GY940_21150 [bacterium]|nr:hypothetical protein [bacterium]